MGNKAESDKGKTLFDMFDLDFELRDKIEAQIEGQQLSVDLLVSAITEALPTIISAINLNAPVGKVIVDLLQDFLTAEATADKGSFVLHYGLLDFEYDDEDAKDDGFAENPIKKKISLIDIVKEFLENEHWWSNSKNFFVAVKKDLEYCASLCQKAIERNLENCEEDLDMPIIFEREYGNFVVQNGVAREADDEDSACDRT